MKINLLLLVFSLVINTVFAQQIRINEIVASNSTYLDEDGNSPDWFELHNFGSTDISLNGWGITDNVGQLNKWVFPDMVIKPDEYMLVWASGKDKSNISYTRTLVSEGDECKYKMPDSYMGSGWTYLTFDDSGWLTGITGIGYSDGDDKTVVPVGTRSVFVRSYFNISNVSAIENLLLDIDYDDGFVAYINGVEIARANINGTPPAYDSGTITDHEAKMYNGQKPERFAISNFSGILNNGNNVLSIQLHNVSNSSSDLTLIPFLSAIYSTATSDGVTPPAVLELNDGFLHTNFSISSDLDTLILSNNSGDIISQLTAEGIMPGMSVGISSLDGSITCYATPTPGRINDTQEYLGGVTSKVFFSHQGGIVDENITLYLGGNIGSEVIRYTTDRTEPDENSQVYNGAIQINSNTIIRARIFSDNYVPSFTYSKSFIFNSSDHELPVVSLITDPNNLFDNDSGIYVYGDSYDPNIPHWGANFWEDWERPIQFSLYETDKSLGCEFNGGIKIFGGWSRANAQRSLSVFARGRYGTSEIDYKFFDHLNYDKFQSVTLRNSGNDWLNTNIRDAALTSLLRDADIEFLEHRSVVTYINGDYWGIYNIREKANEHYLASKHDIDAETIDLLQYNGEIVEGSNEEYRSLINYIETTDLSNDVNFKYIEDNIDVDNFILYQVAQIYFSNTDWPGNNIKYWKHPGGKWRWILYDTDFGFGFANNYTFDALSFATQPYGPNWPNPPWSTLLFRRLLTNESFKHRFINRFADELNSRFLYTNVSNHIQSVYDKISPEINRHVTRWGAGGRDIQGNVNNMKTFAYYRSGYVKLHIKNKFGIDRYYKLTIENDNINQGFVEINNNLIIKQQSWNGDYFKDVPLTLKAVPLFGYEFSHWEGEVSSTESEIEINLYGASTIKPYFVKSTTITSNLVISEINYNSDISVDAGDWMEIYNPNKVAVDISDWVIKDNDDANMFIIPEGTSIEAESFLVICRKPVDFNTAFPEVTNYMGDLNFGFSSTGDAVRLYDNNGMLHDEVYYLPFSPWPVCANGNGPTLELINTSYDNALAESWACSDAYGSPGTDGNTVGTGDNISKENISLFPNPVNDYLYVRGLGEETTYSIFDINGKLIMSDFVKDKINVAFLKHGIYVIRFSELPFKAYKIVKEY